MVKIEMVKIECESEEKITKGLVKGTRGFYKIPEYIECPLCGKNMKFDPCKYYGYYIYRCSNLAECNNLMSAADYIASKLEKAETFGGDTILTDKERINLL